jgi:hypothetical protein
MKRYTPSILSFALSFFVALLPFNVMANVQPDGKGVKEGKISYKIDEASLDPQFAAFLGDMTMEILFDDSNLRVDLSSSMMSNTSVFAKDGSVLVLMNLMGQQIAMNEIQEPTAGTVTETEETKSIAGYDCRKVIYTQDGVSLVFYVTSKIKAPNLSSTMPIEQLGGYPLQIEVNQGGMQMSFVAESVSAEKVDKGAFSTDVPNGYQLMSQDELTKMLGGF